MTENVTPAPLSGFRARIDAIDDQLIALLRERAGIVHEVAAYKHANEQNRHALRPGRETLMVRRIYAAFKDSTLAPEVAAMLWRHLIAGSTTIETPLPLSVYAPAQDLRYALLARDYFGPILPMTREATPARALSAVFEDKHTIAVLPAPEESPEPWWKLLAERQRENGPYLFACLPFLLPAKPDRSAVSAVTVAFATPEPTGEDATYLVLRTTPETSTHRLQGIAEKTGFKARWVQVENAGGERWHLVHAEGWVDPKNPESCPEYHKFLSEAGGFVLGTVRLGAYGLPIKTSASSAKHDSETPPHDR